MSGIVQIRPQAKLDLIEAAVYIKRTSAKTANRLLAAAEKVFELLAEKPEGGSPWESDNPKLAAIRFIHIKGFPKHLVFYRNIPAGVEIVRVLHSSRDIQTILESP